MADRTEISTELNALSVHCRPPIMEVEQRALWLRDWCSDLADFPIDTIRVACRKWRLSGSAKFPTPGQLKPLLEAELPQEAKPHLQPWRPATEDEYRAMSIREKIRERQILAMEAYRKAGPMFRNATAGQLMVKARGDHLKAEEMPDAWRHWIGIANNHRAEAQRLRERLGSYDAAAIQ